MGVENSPFQSKSERDNYYKLHRAWGENYRIYHNLPFLNVFNPRDLVDYSDWKSLRPVTITEIEFNRLKKTSIDYTLCDDNDKPILCIEFDGMQQGFNVKSKYYPDRKIGRGSPWRRKITELKLRVAIGSLFPYFVVGSKYFQDLPLDFERTIVDGIIGEVVSHRDMQKKVSSFNIEKELGMTEDEFAELPQWEKDEYLQTWVWDAETISDLDNNPIVNERAKLEFELRGKHRGYEIHFLSYPDFAPGDIEGFENIILHGSKVIYKTFDFGSVEGIAWLPNFGVPGFSGITLVEEIAALYALVRLKQMVKNAQG